MLVYVFFCSILCLRKEKKTAQTLQILWLSGFLGGTPSGTQMRCICRARRPKASFQYPTHTKKLKNLPQATFLNRFLPSQGSSPFKEQKTKKHPNGCFFCLVHHQGHRCDASAVLVDRKQAFSTRLTPKS